MRLTVLGSSASYAGPGQACAGYLVETEHARILLDCGNGVVSNLGRVADPLALDAVFVTHGHVDHFADVYALQALLRYAPTGPAAPLPLYVGAGVYARIEGPLSEKGRRELGEAFLLHEMSHGHAVTVGDIHITPMLVDHAEPTFALRVEQVDRDAWSAAALDAAPHLAAAPEASLCYTSDTALGERALEAARGCELLLAEATLPQAYAGRAPHLTAREAATLAAQAEARTLVLTHVWPTNDRDEMLREAREVFGGPVEMARELDTYRIGSGARDEEESR